MTTRPAAFSRRALTSLAVVVVAGLAMWGCVIAAVLGVLR